MEDADAESQAAPVNPLLLNPAHIKISLNRMLLYTGEFFDKVGAPGDLKSLIDIISAATTTSDHINQFLEHIYAERKESGINIELDYKTVCQIDTSLLTGIPALQAFKTKMDTILPSITSANKNPFNALIYIVFIHYSYKAGVAGAAAEALNTLFLNPFFFPFHRLFKGIDGIHDSDPRGDIKSFWSKLNGGSKTLKEAIIKSAVNPSTVNPIDDTWNDNTAITKLSNWSELTSSAGSDAISYMVGVQRRVANVVIRPEKAFDNIIDFFKNCTEEDKLRHVLTIGSNKGLTYENASDNTITYNGITLTKLLEESDIRRINSASPIPKEKFNFDNKVPSSKIIEDDDDDEDEDDDGKKNKKKEKKKLSKADKDANIHDFSLLFAKVFEHKLLPPNNTSRHGVLDCAGMTMNQFGWLTTTPPQYPNYNPDIPPNVTAILSGTFDSSSGTEEGTLQEHLKKILYDNELLKSYQKICILLPEATLDIEGIEGYVGMKVIDVMQRFVISPSAAKAAGLNLQFEIWSSNENKGGEGEWKRDYNSNNKYHCPYIISPTKSGNINGGIFDKKKCPGVNETIRYIYDRYGQHYMSFLKKGTQALGALFKSSGANPFDVDSDTRDFLDIYDQAFNDLFKNIPDKNKKFEIFGGLLFRIKTMGDFFRLADTALFQYLKPDGAAILNTCDGFNFINSITCNWGLSSYGNPKKKISICTSIAIDPGAIKKSQDSLLYNKWKSKVFDYIEYYYKYFLKVLDVEVAIPEIPEDYVLSSKLYEILKKKIKNYKENFPSLIIDEFFAKENVKNMLNPDNFINLLKAIEAVVNQIDEIDKKEFDVLEGAEDYDGGCNSRYKEKHIKRFNDNKEVLQQYKTKLLELYKRILYVCNFLKLLKQYAYLKISVVKGKLAHAKSFFDFYNNESSLSQLIGILNKYAKKDATLEYNKNGIEEPDKNKAQKIIKELDDAIRDYDIDILRRLNNPLIDFPPKIIENDDINVSELKLKYTKSDSDVYNTTWEVKPDNTTTKNYYLKTLALNSIKWNNAKEEDINKYLQQFLDIIQLQILSNGNADGNRIDQISATFAELFPADPVDINEVQKLEKLKFIPNTINNHDTLIKLRKDLDSVVVGGGSQKIIQRGGLVETIETIKEFNKYIYDTCIVKLEKVYRSLIKPEKTPHNTPQKISLVASSPSPSPKKKMVDMVDMVDMFEDTQPLSGEEKKSSEKLKKEPTIFTQHMVKNYTNINSIIQNYFTTLYRNWVGTIPSNIKPYVMRHDIESHAAKRHLDIIYIKNIYATKKKYTDAYLQISKIIDDLNRFFSENVGITIEELTQDITKEERNKKRLDKLIEYQKNLNTEISVLENYLLLGSVTSLLNMVITYKKSSFYDFARVESILNEFLDGFKPPITVPSPERLMLSPLIKSASEESASEESASEESASEESEIVSASRIVSASGIAIGSERSVSPDVMHTKKNKKSKIFRTPATNKKKTISRLNSPSPGLPIVEVPPINNDITSLQIYTYSAMNFFMDFMLNGIMYGKKYYFYDETDNKVVYVNDSHTIAAEGAAKSEYTSETQRQKKQKMSKPVCPLVNYDFDIKKPNIIQILTQHIFCLNEEGIKEIKKLLKEHEKKKKILNISTSFEFDFVQALNGNISFFVFNDKYYYDIIRTILGVYEKSKDTILSCEKLAEIFYNFINKKELTDLYKDVDNIYKIVKEEEENARLAALDTVMVTESESGSEAVSEPGSDSGSESGSEPEVEVVSESGSEPEVEVVSESGSELVSDVLPVPGSDVPVAPPLKVVKRSMSELESIVKRKKPKKSASSVNPASMESAVQAGRVQAGLVQAGPVHKKRSNNGSQSQSQSNKAMKFASSFSEDSSFAGGGVRRHRHRHRHRTTKKHLIQKKKHTRKLNKRLKKRLTKYKQPTSKKYTRRRLSRYANQS